MRPHALRLAKRPSGKAPVINGVFQIIFGLVGLSLLVFVHELGHFLVAKRAGVRVHTFSIGFGRKLVKIKRGETEYCISAIPFGGYVAMAGEDPEDQDEAGPRAGDFPAASIPWRAAIAFAGPAVNIVFAFVALWVVYLAGVPEIREDRLAVGYIEPESPATTAGLKSGDTIVAIDGVVPQGWDKFHEQVAVTIGRPIALTVRRAGHDRLLSLTPLEFRDFGIGWAGALPLRYVVVAEPPAAGTPAAVAGFQKDDTLHTVEGRLITSRSDVIQVVEASKGKPIHFEVSRPGATVEIEVAAIHNEVEKRWMIGVSLQGVDPNPPPIVKRAPGDAAAAAYAKGVEYAKLPFTYLHRMATRQVKAKAMSGPVGIVQVIGRAVNEDLRQALMLLALISMNLGVMNLLPLAVTDGGVLLFLGLEALRGKPLSREVQRRIQVTAFMLIILLFVYVTFQDILRFTLLLE
jgi:regulator of sigma E protease